MLLPGYWLSDRFLKKIFDDRKFLMVWLTLLIVVVLTGSRIGIAAFLVASIGPFLPLIKSISWKVKIIFSLIGSVVILVIFLIGARERNSPLFESRTVYRKMAISFIREKPILGWGAESQEVLYEKAFRKREAPLENLIVDRAHNLFLDVAIWSGIVGLLLFCGYLVTETVKKPLSILRLTAILGWFVFALFQPLGATHWVYLMVLLKEA